MATILTALASGQAVSAEADVEMVDILARQEFDNMIPAGLPEHVRVAHKTGGITKIDHDAAIVYPEGRGPYVLVILVEGIVEKDESSALGAKIAAAIHGQIVDS